MHGVNVSRFVDPADRDRVPSIDVPQATMAALQAELAGLDSHKPANVKVERAPSPITVPQRGEVIDLTLDD